MHLFRYLSLMQMDITEIQGRQQDALKSNSVQTETTQWQEKLEPVLSQYFRTGTHGVWKQRARDFLEKKVGIQNQKEGGRRGGNQETLSKIII